MDPTEDRAPKIKINVNKNTMTCDDFIERPSVFSLSFHLLLISAII
jgi:hypothetical protein